MNKYCSVNSKVFEEWKRKYNLKWMRSISHADFCAVRNGKSMLTLTPIKRTPLEWYSDCAKKKVLGIAAGGGQQMPVFAALGAECTLIDISDFQLQSDFEVSQREGYDIFLIKGDMSEKLPFEDDTFDIVINPVSNHYIEDPAPLFKEIYRVLKKGGKFLAGLDNCFYWPINPKTMKVQYKLPINPLKDKSLYEKLMKEENAIQFSHFISEQIGGQLKAGFRLVDIYDDTEEGIFQELNIQTYFATYSIKE